MIAILLGVLQGLTEFFPVSSSGHLPLFGDWFGLTEPDLTFDIILHLATLAAILAVFRKDWIQLIKMLIKGKATDMPDRIVVYLVAATIPAVLVGFAFRHAVELFHSHPEWVGICLACMGVILLGGLFVNRKTCSYRSMTWTMVWVMGLAQAIALLPGISRSGITIMAGFYLGLNRTDAARFSFLMAVPVICGAGVMAVWDLIQKGSQLTPAIWGIYTAGFLAAFVTGFFALAFLLRLLQARRFFYFGVYCLLLGVAAWIF